MPKILFISFNQTSPLSSSPRTQFISRMLNRMENLLWPKATSIVCTLDNLDYSSLQEFRVQFRAFWMPLRLNFATLSSQGSFESSRIVVRKFRNLAVQLCNLLNMVFNFQLPYACKTFPVFLSVLCDNLLLTVVGKYSYIFSYCNDGGIFYITGSTYALNRSSHSS